MKRSNHLHILLLLTYCLFIGCEKEKVELNTTIYGQFYDTFNEEPYQKLSIKIAEYERVKGKLLDQPTYELVKVIDSTVTDTEGNYRLSFTTSDPNKIYFIEFTDLPANVDIQYKGTPSKGEPVAYLGYGKKSISALGTVQEYSFDVYRRYSLKTRIIVKDNPYPPLYIAMLDVNGRWLISGKTIEGRNADTVIYLPIKKSNQMYLQFHVLNQQGTALRNPNILLNLSVSKDTIEGGEYSVYPSQFK